MLVGYPVRDGTRVPQLPEWVSRERSRPPTFECAAYYFLPGRCVRAEAAALLATLLELGLLSTFPAADAAFVLVTSLFDFATEITSFRFLVQRRGNLSPLRDHKLPQRKSNSSDLRYPTLPDMVFPSA